LLGKVAFMANDFQTAESAYLQALENEPRSGRALWGLAKAFESLGKEDDAEEMLEEYRQVWRGEALQ